MFDYTCMPSDTIKNENHLYSSWNYSFILELNETLEIIYCKFAHFIGEEININSQFVYPRPGIKFNIYYNKV